MAESTRATYADMFDLSGDGSPVESRVVARTSVVVDLTRPSPPPFERALCDDCFYSGNRFTEFVRTRCNHQICLACTKSLYVTMFNACPVCSKQLD